MKKLSLSLLSVLLVLTIFLTSCQGTSTDKSHADGCIDNDNNGICDVCHTSVIETVDFYAINDLHGKFANTSSDEGVDEMTTYLKDAYEKNDHSITLSSGDMWQGTAESGVTKGKIVTEWMNYIGTVSMTLGNHEFDWGEEQIIANAEIADFPFLAINIYDADTNEIADYCSPSVTVECGNVTVGIIGAIGDCYSSISSDMTDGIYFKTGDELTKLVKEESEKLRRDGADFVVYSLHDGYEKSKSGTQSIGERDLYSYYATELSRDGYVDLVFEGHTHQSYVLKDTWGVYHLQDGGENQGISHVEVCINFANGNSDINVAEFVEDDDYVNLDADSIVSELETKYNDKLSYINSVLGYNGTYRKSDYLCDLVAELYMEKGKEIWGETHDIVLSGGFLSARSPYNLKVGDIKYTDLYSIFPFNNQLVLGKIKGSDLLSKFINTTNDRYHVSYTNGLESTIDKNAYYYIVTDTYTSTYKYNNIEEIERYPYEVYARDLLADYIANGGLK